MSEQGSGCPKLRLTHLASDTCHITGSCTVFCSARLTSALQSVKALHSFLILHLSSTHLPLRDMGGMGEKRISTKAMLIGDGSQYTWLSLARVRAAHGSLTVSKSSSY